MFKLHLNECKNPKLACGFKVVLNSEHLNGMQLARMQRQLARMQRAEVG
jgi:hypothetical protein